ncbi:MAG: YdcF family protein [Cellulomonas sp.]|nr:YdcF family protein [Cellulomonas sp.]
MKLRSPWLWALAAVLAATVGPMIWVQAIGQREVAPNRQAVRRAPVAIVFGAGLKPGGAPSVYLARRLEAARSLYAAGEVGVILVSGDNGTPAHDEPTAMRDWLVSHGVPDAAIVRDFAGFDTHDTCVRAHDVFGVDDAVLLTQDYHLRRALFSCEAAGVRATGLGVSSSSVSPMQAFVWRLRELPASWKAWWDATTGRTPRFDGPPETAVSDALRQSGWT